MYSRPGIAHLKAEGILHGFKGVCGPWSRSTDCEGRKSHATRRSGKQGFFEEWVGIHFWKQSGSAIWAKIDCLIDSLHYSGVDDMVLNCLEQRTPYEFWPENHFLWISNSPDIFGPTGRSLGLPDLIRGSAESHHLVPSICRVANAWVIEHDFGHAVQMALHNP